MKGPFPIFCRGHSGGRLLCEAFIHNGFWMGISDGKTRDAKEFAERNPVVKQLVEAAFRYPEMSPAEKAHWQQTLRGLVETSENNCANPDSYVAYGWKRAITTFMIEIFIDAFPDSKVVHLIRDGRDLMLSRLNSRMRRVADEPFSRRLVLGDANITQYREKPLTWKIVKAYRNEFEMLHWMTAVRFGMRGRAYPGRYLEILYEDICANPVETLARVFDFLEIPFRPQAREWITQHASKQRIGKWKLYEEQLQDAIRIGEPLLRELGYI